MGTRKPKPSLPPVVVVLQPGQPTPAQASSWARLWSKLLSPEKGKPPVAAGGGGDGTDGNQKQASDGKG